ncbi:MAG: hypothetical protein BGN87_24030 [Rhizobiales bacterium 65-79]|nr:MAG: hypothetical protein BGN87_24030 [Rhizobiales bacterium 65-79]
MHGAARLVATGESPSPGRKVFLLAGPAMLPRRVKRAAVGEGELPGMRADGVYGIKVRAPLLVRTLHGTAGAGPG